MPRKKSHSTPHPMVAATLRKFAEHANPDKAAGMQAYMKTTQHFHGIQRPLRRQILKEVLADYTIHSFDEYCELVLALWQGKSREEMYQAIAIATHFKAFHIDAAMDLYEQMLTTASNWDLVDGIAPTLVGKLVQQNRKHEKRLKKWLRSPNMWFRRAALLAHLKHKQDTNTQLLAETILKLAPEKEFFIRKAIGWTLREYARTDAPWVKSFVKTHSGILSPLSQREALKHQT